jgi:hypothetical protein
MVIIDVGRYDNMSVSDELNKIYKMLSKQPFLSIRSPKTGQNGGFFGCKFNIFPI